MAESTGVEPARLFREPLFSRQVPYRPAHSPKLGRRGQIRTDKQEFLKLSARPNRRARPHSV